MSAPQTMAPAGEGAPPQDEMPTTAKGGKAPADKHKRSWFARIVLIVACVLWTIPTIGLLVTSVRPRIATQQSGWWEALFNPFGAEWTLKNFEQVLANNGMFDAFINSFVVTVPATILPIMFAAFAAYAFTFMRFRGRDLLFIVVIGLMVVPIQSTFVTLLQLFGNDGLDINGEFLALWLLHTTFGMPLCIYILRNYMSTLPKSVIESAEIDGASHFQTFWKLIVPMSVPALAAYAIFQFLWVWNDLLIALLFLGFNDPVLTVNLSQLNGRLGEGWQLLTAGAFVTMIVPMIVFFALQRFFIRGMTSGAVKG
ncbi:MAG: carbohydrate ABC transporter permease [Actinomycetes bacterium]